MGSFITLTAADGHEFQAYRAPPAASPRAGLVVIQEIFGVNAHIREVTDGFAADGFLAIAPALYDRAERGFDADYTPEEMTRGRELRAEIGWDAMMTDVAAAADNVREAGKVGIVGYCMGGSVAWLAAARLAMDAAVGYYGGNIYNDRAEAPQCPTMLHFGEVDQAIPLDTVHAVDAMHPDVPVFIYAGADHGFICDHRASYHAEATALAGERTRAFFGEHLG